MFLLHQWDTVLDYSQGSINEAKTVEASILNFIGLVEAIGNDLQPAGHNYGQLEKDFMTKYFILMIVYLKLKTMSMKQFVIHSTLPMPCKHSDL